MKTKGISYIAYGFSHRDSEMCIIATSDNFLDLYHQLSSVCSRYYGMKIYSLFSGHIIATYYSYKGKLIEDKD